MIRVLKNEKKEEEIRSVKTKCNKKRA